MLVNKAKSSKIFWEILLLVSILILGAFFRFYGINWDDDFHLHPDERFLTMVETAISPVGSLNEYFDTSESSLNPHNSLDAAGNSVFPFFVYGTFPLFVVRYVGSWLGMTGYSEINIVGRYLSGAVDIGTILIVWLISRELFKKKWLSYIAALLYACAILPIQISHFFIVDNFATFFSALALLFAVHIQKMDEHIENTGDDQGQNPFISHWNGFRYYAFFGIALGLAAASKINTIVVAALLPMAVVLKDGHWFQGISSLKWKLRLRNLILAGVISFVIFRIFQPYAFTGPGFFGILPNPKWIANLRELSFLSSGDSNYPPSIQWARRSFWFPIKNLVIWGLGLPVGILAAVGLIWIAFKLVRGQKKEFLLLWIFTSLYMVWQALRWNPTMRYFLILYPILAIFAAWVVGRLVNVIKKIKKPTARKILNGSLLVGIIAAVILGPVSFMNIYTQPMTRIAASEWIYQHIPGAVNLDLTDSESSFIQPLPYPNLTRLDAGDSITFRFSPVLDGQMATIEFDHIVNQGSTNTNSALSIVISSVSTGTVLFSQTVQDRFMPVGDPRGEPFEIYLDTPFDVSEDKEYQIDLSIVENQDSLQFLGNLSVGIISPELSFSQPVFEFTRILDSENVFEASFSPIRESQLEGFEFFRWLSLSKNKPVQLKATVIDINSGNKLITQQFVVDEKEKKDFRGSPVKLEFAKPIMLSPDGIYSLRIEVNDPDARIAINGSKAVKETDWDDVLPLFMYGYNPFDSYQGIYASDLNFQVYWDDDQSKLTRFLEGLYQADYFIITSSRQWGSVTQIPERYPLTTYFYRQMIGCQVDDVQNCYRIAQPGMFKGQLGFDLAKTFQVEPSIFGLEFNSQFAEEAFTVYDHPKVLIFEKSNDFSFENIAQQLTSIDLDHVLNISIKEADQRPGLLTLSPSRYEAQKSGGTWSSLFNLQSVINTNQFLTVIVWYLFITLLGWVSYPLVRVVFSGLNDKGFPLAKLAGLILWAFITWFGSSNGIPFSRLFIALTLIVVIALNAFIFIRKRKIILLDIKKQWRYFATIELISLGLFLFFLLIRLGNPDLWHPYKGGEKPMDFAYLNAVIKSVQFPPYDPWYAGGYINYYYFGFVISGIIVKLLGIVPSIAYNLILPTFFSFSGMAAFSLGWNLFLSSKNTNGQKNRSILNSPYLWGMVTVIFVLLIGNLGTVTMFFKGFIKLGMTGAQTIGVGFLDKLGFFFKGIIRFFQGENFGYYPGDWYWIPSRAIPGTVITEFPYFTFLYGDPHAHMFAYPITLVALGWSLSVVLGKFNLSRFWETAAKILIGALLIGTLRPTNTWDFPVFLAIGCVSVIYALFIKKQFPEKFMPHLNKKWRLIIYALLFVIVLVVVSFILFSSFDRWYGQAYSSVELWLGDKTPIWAYLVHWGFFLFILVSWIIFSVWQWMESTPLSFLAPYYKWRKYFILAGFLLLLLLAGLIVYGVKISLIALPLIIIFLVILFFDKKASDAKRFVIFLLLTGLGLTLMVELVALKGDIGRMNTVFKFYLQAWTFFAVGSAFLLKDLLLKLSNRRIHRDHSSWRVIFGLIGISVLLFPLMASIDKINDRISDSTPVTLDGMEFMKYSTYSENDRVMDLSQDYYAIRWMQENVKGTPVIVEGNVPEYQWGNRFSIYTGLPSVVGWNWHQRQQRAINPGDWIFERVDEVTEFYSTTDIKTASDFIEKYDVQYIVLGQLEKAVYPLEGLRKFSEFSGKLWDIVYESADTRIFKVKG